MVRMPSNSTKKPRSWKTRRAPPLYLQHDLVRKKTELAVGAVARIADQDDGRGRSFNTNIHVKPAKACMMPICK